MRIGILSYVYRHIIAYIFTTVNDVLPINYILCTRVYGVIDLKRNVATGLLYIEIIADRPS